MKEYYVIDDAIQLSPMKCPGLRELLLACARRFESINNDEPQDDVLIADLAKILRSYAG